MKKIINGRRYDTDTATHLASAYSNLEKRDFGYWEEELYRKNTGEFFIYGWGGPASRYSVSAGNNSWSGGEKIIPVTLEAAQEWAEKYLDGDKYEEIFGVVEETAEKRTVTFSLPLDVIEKIKRQAADAGCTMSDLIEKLVRNN